MKVFCRVALGTLLSATAVMPAAAQTFDKVVAFGDSYADTGNVKALLTNAGLGSFFNSTEYPTGRFSGGTNFVDTIASAYGVSQDNYAIGGAQAGTGNVAAQGLLPGFAQQWTAFTQGGSTYTSVALSEPIYVSGQATVIPSGGLQFARDDLAVFSVGGNDARGYRIGGGTVAGADAAAATTAADATAGLDALVARGIRHMVWTAGDVGQLAEAIGQPSAAAGTAFSVAYNSRMQAVLAPIARSGVQIAYVDITTIGQTVRADPARFGFIDTTHACPQTCIGNPALQSQYLFYVDGVHLTSAGFALVGDYAVNQLGAPYGLRAVGDLPLLEARQFGQDMGNRLDLARDDHSGRDGLSVFGNFDAAHQRRGADATADGYDYNSRGGLGGVEYKAGPTTGGLVFSYARGKIDGAGDDRIRGRSYQIGGYAVADPGTFFSQGYIGYGWHRLDVRRTGVADPLTADPHATSLSAGGRVGWLPPTRFGRIGPVVGLDYAHARVKGYTEAGDAAATLIVSRQRIDTLVGSAGLEYRPALGARLSPWLRATAEKTLNGDGRDLSYAPTVAPTIVNGFAIGRTSERVYGAAAGGITAHLTPRLALDGSVRASIDRPDGHDVAGFAGLKLAF